MKKTKRTLRTNNERRLADLEGLKEEKKIARRRSQRYQ